MKNKLCIFDFDGVILDTEKYHYLAWAEVLAQYGIKFSYEQYEPLKSTGRSSIINSVCSIFGVSFSDEQIATICAHKGTTYSALIANLSQEDLLPNVSHFIERLASQQGVTLAVASASCVAKSLLAQYDLAKYFALILDGSDKLPSKPAPDIYLTCAQRLQVDSEQCVVFEDSSVGIVGATSAGMHSVYIGTTTNDMAELCVADFSSVELEGYMSAFLCCD